MISAFRALPILAALCFAAACDNSAGQASAAGGESSAGAPGQGGPGGRGPGGRGPGGRGGGSGLPTPVEISIVERGAITRTTTLTGIVEPIRRVGVNAQLTGALLSVDVEEGTVVRREQVLARIDARELELQLASANASHAAAQSAMERADKMRAAGIYTDVEYERDRTALAAALSQRDQLQTRLSYAQVKSPLDGIVVEKRIEAGDVVGTQTRLFTIADISTLVVRVNVSELEVGALRVGQRVDVAVDALEDQTVTGSIRRIFPSADSSSRLVPVELQLSGAGVRLVKPGFLTRATFQSNARENALLVPASAIVVSGGASAVYLIQDGMAARRNVRTGLTYAGRMEILEGVEVGDSVIVAGNTSVRDGGAVRVVQSVMGDDRTVDIPSGRGGDGSARGGRGGRGDSSGTGSGS